MTFDELAEIPREVSIELLSIRVTAPVAMSILDTEPALLGPPWPWRQVE
jgi:hypothetical protein